MKRTNYSSLRTGNTLVCSENKNSSKCTIDRNIGKASKAPKGELYAVIGLGYKGARIAVNFGSVHFHYEAIKA